MCLNVVFSFINFEVSIALFFGVRAYVRKSVLVCFGGNAFVWCTGSCVTMWRICVHA